MRKQIGHDALGPERPIVDRDFLSKWRRCNRCGDTFSTTPLRRLFCAECFRKRGADPGSIRYLV